MNYKLTVELVPSTAWYTNVRSNVTRKEWDILRKASYEKAGHKCEICGGKGKEQGYSHDVECHEIWEYDDINKIQKLIGLISLCPICHKVKHFGLAQINGEAELAMEQIMKVNQINEEECKKYLHNVFVIWFERSRYKWTLDITYVTEFLQEQNNKPWWQQGIQ